MVDLNDYKPEYKEVYYNAANVSKEDWPSTEIQLDPSLIDEISKYDSELSYPNLPGPGEPDFDISDIFSDISTQASEVPSPSKRRPDDMTELQIEFSQYLRKEGSKTKAYKDKKKQNKLDFENAVVR